MAALHFGAVGRDFRGRVDELKQSSSQAYRYQYQPRVGGHGRMIEELFFERGNELAKPNCSTGH
jgi:hypothetical protein